MELKQHIRKKRIQKVTHSEAAHSKSWTAHDVTRRSASDGDEVCWNFPQSANAPEPILQGLRGAVFEDGAAF